MSLPSNEENPADKAKFDQEALERHRGRRPVPHITHTTELEDAALAVSLARRGGHPILLCRNPLDVQAVRDALSSVSEGLKDPSFTYEAEEPAVEITALEHLVLLAILLREHLKAGNT